MKKPATVGSPPAKPLMIYDGDCGFCGRWIQRWKRTTADRVEYLPFQDPSIAARFPELPREAFERSVHLVEPDAWEAGIALRELRDEYGYIASEWLAAGQCVVLLEKLH